MTDYSAPLTYKNIEASILHSVDRMDELTKIFAGTADEYGRAEAAFKSAYAKSRLSARIEGPINGVKVTSDMAEDIATVDTEVERMAMETAKAKNDSTRQALMSVRSRLEVLRSLMASYRD